MSNFKISDLHTYIVKVAEKELNKSSFLDTVTTGTITASHPGYYQVSLTNSGDVSSVNALPMNDATYAINDYVYLLKAPAKGGDNFNNSYYIFGKVSETKETYANLTDWERFNGNLTTVKIDGGNIVTDSGYLEATFDNENLIKDIQESGYFSISGYFTANKSEDFGLIIELHNDTNAIQTFKLDKNYFTGQIIALTNAYQKRICSITDESKLAALKKIVVKGFNNTNGKNPQVQDITITAGSMYEAANSLEVKVTILSGYKDYFRNMTPTEAGQDQIGLKATLYYNNQPLAADNIRYYWCIKDSTATSENSLPFIESGWRCLNGYSEVDFLDSEETETIQVWQSSSSMIIDEFDGSFKNDLGQNINTNVYTNIFDKTYNNTVVCFVKYNGRIFKSDEKNIINYNLHNFKVSLDLNSGNVSDVQKIIYENDAVTAHCTITAEQDGKTLPLPQHAEYTYQWQVKADDLDITECLKREDQNLNEILGYSKIIIKDEKTIDKTGSVTQSALDTLTIELPEFVTIKDISHDIKNATIKVSALISIKADGAESDAIKLQTNEIQIESHTHELEQIHSVFSYKYYLSESMNVTFEKEPRKDENGNIIVGSWSGGWDIKDPIEADENKENWKEDLSKDEWDADNLEYTQMGWDELNELTPSSILENSVDTSKKYYLYYTKQEDIFKYIGSEQEETPLDSRTWQYPLVLNVFTWNGQNGVWIKMSSIEIDQINTFNQLTKGGTEDGIFYQEEAYVLTEDTTKQPEKTYYTATYSADKTTYTKFNGISFAEGVSYYEKSSDKNKLYINATYINTGTLRVGDSIREKFYASIHNPDVRIAGWEVDDHSLTKGTVGINSDSTENDGIAFWAGDKSSKNADFYVTHDGHVVAKSIEIGGSLKDTIDKIEKDTSTAVANANSALNTANSAEGSAATANQIAAIAESVAQEANVNSTNAINTANAASGRADEAVNAATTANENSTNAINIANGASSAAAGAVSKVDSLAGELYFGATTIDGTDVIALKAKNGIIYAHANGLIINSDRLKLDHDGNKYNSGYFSIDTNYFKVDKDGKITATAGTIGGYSIGQYTIASGDSLDLSGTESENDAKGANHTVGMCMKSGHGLWAFWAGEEATFGAKKFRVGHNGVVHASEAYITGNSTFGGTLTAPGGTIGGYNINGTTLESTDGKVGMSSSTTVGDYSFWAGNATQSSAPFYVKNNGYMRAISGNIAGFDFTTSKLQSGDFILETFSSGDNKSGILKFVDTSDNTKVGSYINYSSISTATVNCAALTASDQISTPIGIIGDLTISESSIKYGNLAAITFANDGKDFVCTASVDWYGKDIWVETTLALPIDVVFTIHYKHWASSWEFTTITIKAGDKKGTKTTQHLFDVDNAKLYSDGLEYSSMSLKIKNPSNSMRLTGNLSPSQSETYMLGEPSLKWDLIYVDTLEVTTSDKNKKNTITSLSNKYEYLFDNLKPVSYKFNNNSSDRTHIGFIAQDVEKTIIDAGLTTQDFAGVCYWDNSDGTKGYGLRYGEFIPLNTHEIQKLKKRVTEQDQRILELEEKISNLEKLIQPSEN